MPLYIPGLVYYQSLINLTMQYAPCYLPNVISESHAAQPATGSSKCVVVRVLQERFFSFMVSRMTNG